LIGYSSVPQSHGHGSQLLGDLPQSRSGSRNLNLNNARARSEQGVGKRLHQSMEPWKSESPLMVCEMGHWRLAMSVIGWMGILCPSHATFRGRHRLAWIIGRRNPSPSVMGCSVRHALGSDSRSNSGVSKHRAPLSTSTSIPIPLNCLPLRLLRSTVTS
jgi:hypothetical protein